MNAIALLLAAGESQRMGSSKALLPWRDQPLISHQVLEIAMSRVSRTVVVLGRDAEQLLPHLANPVVSAAGLSTVINRHAESGRCSSVIAGLNSLPERADAIFVVSVDQPVERTLLDALLDAAAAEWERGEAGSRRTIVVPSHAGRRGHPPLFHGSLIPEMLRIIEASQGLKAVVRRRPERVLDLPCDSAEVLLNLNRPDDLQSAHRGSGRPRSPV